MEEQAKEDQAANSRCPASAGFSPSNCSASEPLRRSFSEQELRDAALAWMRKSRAEGYEPDAEKYHAKLGLLVDFVTDLMRNTQDEEPASAGFSPSTCYNKIERVPPNLSLIKELSL